MFMIIKSAGYKIHLNIKKRYFTQKGLSASAFNDFLVFLSSTYVFFLIEISHYVNLCRHKHTLMMQ